MSGKRAKITVGRPTVLPSGPDVTNMDTGEKVPMAVWALRREREARRAAEAAKSAGQPDPGLGLNLSAPPAAPRAERLTPNFGTSAGPDTDFLKTSAIIQALRNRMV
jgi:hypothetical protein